MATQPLWAVWRRSVQVAYILLSDASLCDQHLVLFLDSLITMKVQSVAFAASALLSGAAATIVPAQAAAVERALEYVIKPKMFIVSML